ncbi:MAG: hypothetical protein IJB96_09025 [Lachnospira sp.]|nr:hypothetical protein [Lachnospira sp.]
MAKGNINYKYLRRRNSSWFSRNWKFILVWIILILAIAGLVALVYFKLL